MPQADDQAERFTILCLRCERAILARAEWVGREVRCPHCSSVLRVPPRPPVPQIVRAEPPRLAPRRLFNFPCPRCACLLEASTGAGGDVGSCPTCAARFRIPTVDPLSGLPGPAELIDSERTDPTPLHAYAASGHQAPQIRRRADGVLEIKCPRCGSSNPIQADACASCSAPFTLESAATTARIQSEGLASAALVVGLLAIPTFFLVVPGLMAVVLGLACLWRGPTGVILRRGLAGLVLGLVSLAFGAALWLA